MEIFCVYEHFGLMFTHFNELVKITQMKMTLESGSYKQNALLHKSDYHKQMLNFNRIISPFKWRTNSFIAI